MKTPGLAYGASLEQPHQPGVGDPRTEQKLQSGETVRLSVQADWNLNPYTQYTSPN